MKGSALKNVNRRQSLLRKSMSLDSRQHYFELLPKGNPVTTHDSSSADDFLVRLIDTEPGKQVAALVSLREKVFGSTSELIWVRKV
jgi:hypothetical protein